MTTGNAMADIRAMFTKQFPQLTKGKDRSEVKEIMKEMGYGMNTTRATQLNPITGEPI